MTMTLDNQQRFPLNFDHMASYSSSGPQFSNPWSSATAGPSHTAASHSMYGTGSHHYQPQQSHHSSSRTSTAAYGSIPVTAGSSGSPLSMPDQDSLLVGHSNLLSMPQDLMSMPRLPHTSAAGYSDSYSAAAPSPIQPSYSASSSGFDQMGYTAAPIRSTFATSMDTDRRYSQPSVPSILPDPEQIRQPSHRNSLVDMSAYRGLHNDDRRSFADAIEASQGILSLSQETPRPIYGSRTRGSEESYGFPTTHSTSSSVSSQGFSPYYGGSIDSSVSDYSTAGSDIESSASRVLPRPQGLMGGAPPAPQSMMGSFSSKVSSTTQKKHKCKVCDKRFTRPSSLQTHMYSHTGEKPFQCEVEGCGRHFSVVSNLRRHRKVHKGQTPSEADSEDRDHDDDHSQHSD